MLRLIKVPVTGAQQNRHLVQDELVHQPRPNRIFASTDVDAKTNEITRFADLLDRIKDRRDVVVTAGAPHCQRGRGRGEIGTVKRSRPCRPAVPGIRHHVAHTH